MLKQDPYFIAELSANHGGKLETATKIISQVASSGASAIKLQTFTADQMAVRNESNLLPNSSKLWAGKNLWELMKEAEMPLSWHSELFNLAKTLGLEAFSTPYNPESVEFLMTMGASAMKVSSFDVINIPLLEEVAKSRLPIILSTGMATLEEIRTAVSVLVRFGSQVTILK